MLKIYDECGRPSQKIKINMKEKEPITLHAKIQLSTFDLVLLYLLVALSLASRGG